MNLELLIDEVEKRKTLWDIRLSDYRNREVTNQQWIEIANIFGTSPEITKKKWKSLRDNFRSELKKTKVLLKNGSAETTISKKSKWPYFNRMAFLTHVMVNEKSPWKINSNLLSVMYNTSDLLSTAINKSDVFFNDNSSSNSAMLSPPSKKKCLVTYNNNQHLQLNGNISDEEYKSVEINMNCDKNRNYNFLISFLPYMNNMTEIQNLKFRCKMSHLLMECVETQS